MRTNNDPALNTSRPQSFLMKGALLPMSILELRSSDLNIVTEELNAKVSAAPGFFKGNPVVFSFESLDSTDGIDLNGLKSLCNELGLVSTGIKSSEEHLLNEAEKLGLAVFHERKEKNKDSASDNDTAPIQTEQSPKYNVETHAVTDASMSVDTESAKVLETAHIPTKIIDSPVRSGQQVYSPGDMVIMSSVSAGAEVLAEGNIHVYGALRGRALAGVQGNAVARVFCQSQEAELISVAGHFMIDEDLRSSSWCKSVQVFYNGNELEVKVLE